MNKREREWEEGERRAKLCDSTQKADFLLQWNDEKADFFITVHEREKSNELTIVSFYYNNIILLQIKIYVVRNVEYLLTYPWNCCALITWKVKKHIGRIESRNEWFDKACYRVKYIKLNTNKKWTKLLPQRIVRAPHRLRLTINNKRKNKTTSTS